MMDLIVLLTHRGHSQLIQELERRWPGCRAHSKRNQTTGIYDVVWSDLLPRDVRMQIGAFVDGWRDCLKFAITTAQEASPFTDATTSTPSSTRPPPTGARGERRKTPTPPRHPRQDDAARTARARLESLFKDPEEGES